MSDCLINTTSTIVLSRAKNVCCCYCWCFVCNTHMWNRIRISTERLGMCAFTWASSIATIAVSLCAFDTHSLHPCTNTPFFCCQCIFCEFRRFSEYAQSGPKSKQHKHRLCTDFHAFSPFSVSCSEHIHRCNYTSEYIRISQISCSLIQLCTILVSLERNENFMLAQF